MLNRASLLMVVVLLANSLLSVAYRTQLAKITRWRPSFGTLHEVRLWYMPMERKELLPAAKKTFNFTRSEHLRLLASFATSTPRAVLTATFDTDMRDVAAFFAERITLFAEQKKKEMAPVTCVFRMNMAIKNMAVTLRLSRSKSQKLRGDITFYGYLKEPPRELVNLITAAVIDDAPSMWHRWLLLIGGCFAWLKWGEGPLQGPSRANLTQNVAIQTDADAQSSAQDDASQVDFASSPATKPVIDLEMHTQSVGIADMQVKGQTAAMVDAAIQTDDRSCSPRRWTVMGGHDERDPMPEISVRALYGALGVICNQVIWYANHNFASNVRSALLIGSPKPPDYDYRDSAQGCRFTLKNTCVLDDGSIWFSCQDGSARFVVSKSHKELDIERLLQERNTGLVRSDLVVVLHCVDVTAQKKEDAERFLGEYCRSLRARYECLREWLEDFRLIVVPKKHVSRRHRTLRAEESEIEPEIEWAYFELMDYRGYDSLWGPRSPASLLCKIVSSVRCGLARRAEAKSSTQKEPCRS